MSSERMIFPLFHSVWSMLWNGSVRWMSSVWFVMKDMYWKQDWSRWVGRCEHIMFNHHLFYCIVYIYVPRNMRISRDCTNPQIARNIYTCRWDIWEFKMLTIGYVWTSVNKELGIKERAGKAYIQMVAISMCLHRSFLVWRDNEEAQIRWRSSTHQWNMAHIMFCNRTTSKVWLACSLKLEA